MTSIKNKFNNAAVQKGFLRASFFMGVAGIFSGAHMLGETGNGYSGIISGSIFIAMGAYGLGILKERHNPPRPKPPSPSQ